MDRGIVCCVGVAGLAAAGSSLDRQKSREFPAISAMQLADQRLRQRNHDKAPWSVYPASMEAKGMYRKRNGWGNQHSVRVKYDGPELEVPENFYRANGWQPPFDELPWESESGSDANGGDN